MEDHELLQRAAQGDLDAYDTFVRRYQLRIMRFCMKYLHDAQAAEDAAQEVFLKVYQYAGQYEHRGSVAAFVYRVATNYCLDFLKRKRRKAKLMPTISFSASVDSHGDVRSMEDLIPSKTEPPGSELVKAEQRAEFNNALEELPEHHRQALLLYELDNMSYLEIGELLGATLSEVKIWIYRARKKLNKILGETEEKEK